jgi:hypothetical protein
MSSAPCLRELLDELRHQRLVAGGLARDADHVDVVLDGGAGGFGRGLEQRPDVDVEAESAKAVAITLAPRSWPSWPIFTTSSAAGGPPPRRRLDVGADAAAKPASPS